MAKICTLKLRIPYKPSGFRGEELLLPCELTGWARWRNQTGMPVPTHVEVYVTAADSNKWVPVNRLRVGFDSIPIDTANFDKHSDFGVLAKFCFEKSWSVGDKRDGTNKERWHDDDAYGRYEPDVE